MNCIIRKGLKDKDHPYVQIIRSLIDDKEASVGLRFLIITCLSKPDTWQHNATNMANCLGVSKDTIYRYLKEGVELGYVTHIQEKIKGKFGAGIWEVFEEKQELKKCSPCLGFPDTVFPDTENHDYSNNEAKETNSYIERIAREKQEIPPKKPEEKPRENVQSSQSKFRNREVPVFLKFKPLTEKDTQILANKYSDSILIRAKEDSMSYHKKKKIINIAAFMTQRCKHYEKEDQKCRMK